MARRRGGIAETCSSSRAPLRLALVAAVALLVLSSAAPSLGAVTTEEAARAFFVEGRENFAAGRYEKALESFEAANSLLPSFVLQFNIARCLEEALRFDEAVAAFSLVIWHADDATLREKARLQVEAIKVRAAKSGVRVTNHRLGVRVLIDGVAVDLDPTGFVAVSPGTRRVEVWQPFHQPHLHFVEVQLDEIKPITLRVLPPERLTGGAGGGVRDGVIQEVSFFERNWPVLSTMGVGLVGLGVGVTMRVLGQGEWDAIREARRDDDDRITGMSERGAQDRIDTADRYELASFISFGVAGASFLTSALLLALDVTGGGDAEPPRQSAAPALGLELGGMSLRWSW